MLVACLWPALSLAVLWSTLAVLYSNLPWPAARTAAAIVFALACIVVAWRVRPCVRGAAVIGALCVLVFIWYLLIRPSNDRDWQPDVARISTATIRGNLVTISNVRNCRYRTETDFNVRYEDRTYDLSKLATADIAMSYWGPRDICHTFMSFGFTDGTYACCSIETRKEKGEEYSAVQGLYKRYELIYVWGDERDLIGLRTNHRHEDVYLYRFRVKHPERLRAAFEQYLRTTNDLAANPQFYNAVTNSCGMGIVYNITERPQWLVGAYNLLANGHWDELFYKGGVITNDQPFEQLRAASRVNDRANAAAESDDFSAAIRAGLPGITSTKPTK